MTKKTKTNTRKSNGLKEKEENFFKMDFFRQQLEEMRRLGGKLILQQS